MRSTCGRMWERKIRRGGRKMTRWRRGESLCICVEPVSNSHTSMPSRTRSRLSFAGTPGPTSNAGNARNVRCITASSRELLARESRMVQELTPRRPTNQHIRLPVLRIHMKYLERTHSSLLASQMLTAMYMCRVDRR